MTSVLVIVCKTCRSYRTMRLGPPRYRFKCFGYEFNVGGPSKHPITCRKIIPHQARLGDIPRYRCQACGEEFEVADAGEYTKQHSSDIHRCCACDKVSVELVEKGHRPAGRDEIVDVYRCTNCGMGIDVLVKADPNVCYD